MGELGKARMNQASESREMRDRMLVELGKMHAQHESQGKQMTQHIPVYVSNALAAVLKDIQSRGAVTQSKLEGTHAQLGKLEVQLQDSVRRLQVLEKGGDSVMGKVDGMVQQLTALQVRQTSHNRAKGVSGEARLQELLSEQLDRKSVV